MQTADPIHDPLDHLVSPADQRQAATLAQEGFTTAFRQAAAGHSAHATRQVLSHCLAWKAVAPDADAAALRLALLLSGLDQWGLAFSQAFGITAIPALTRLIADLRTQADIAEDARLQGFMEQLDAQESGAIDFKIHLRRDIHLALWHAMACSADADAARPILETLGSLLLALDTRMPVLGWRLVADTLAHIQIRLLGADLPPLAQSGTQQLLDALARTMPAEHYNTILGHAAHVMVDWQRARRAS